MLHSRTMPGMAFWTPPSLLGFAIACSAVSCDDATVASGAPDAAPTDAVASEDAAPDPCALVLATATLRLERCAGGRRFALRRGTETLLDAAQAGFDVAGRRVDTGDYPQVVWRNIDGEAEARFFDLPDLPEVVLRLSLAADVLSIEVTLLGGTGVVVERILPLAAKVTAEDTRAAPELALPGLYVAGLGVDGRGVEAQVRGGALTITTTDPPATLLDSVTAPPVAVRAGDDPRRLRRDHAAALAIRAGTAPDAEVAPWGWTGRAVDAARVGAALRRHAVGLAPPLLVTESVVDVAPARLGLRWAPFRDRDPARPPERDAAAREARAWLEAGVSAFVLELPSASAVGGDALRAAVGAIRAADETATLVARSGGRGLVGRVDAGAPWALETDTPEAQARALVAWWHLAPRVVRPWLGPVRGRQSAVIVALGAGPYLLGDDPEALDSDALAAFFAPLVDGPLGPAEPTDDEDPPATWRSERALAFFNWGDEPRTFAGPDAGPVEVPPHDVVVVLLDPSR